MSETKPAGGVTRRQTLRYLAASGAVLMIGPAAPWSPARSEVPPDSVSIEAYGAVGNEIADCTEAVARAIRAAAAAGRGVYIPDGRYRVREVRLLNGLRFIEGPGWLVGSSAEPEGVVTTNDPGARTPVEGVRISVNVDCARTARGGIFCIGLSRSEIRGCRVVGLSANGGNGIRLNFPNSSGNLIQDNQVILSPAIPYFLYRDGLFGIHVVGETMSPRGGIERGGHPVYVPVTTRDNRVIGNRVSGGTHGIAFFGASGFTCTGNRCEDQEARNIICGPTCENGTIATNQCIDAGSSAVHLALGCRNIAIERNEIRSSRASQREDDDGAIQAYVYCTDIRIVGNNIAGDWKNGIYLVYVARVQVIDNVIDGRGFSLAGISIESGWSPTALPGARYTTPRPLDYAISIDTSDILLRNNVVSGAPASLALAQVGPRRLRTVTIEGGRIGESADAYLFAYEQQPGTLTDLSMADVATPGDSRRFILPRGRGHFRSIRNVAGLN
jgi:nitrous oxidase accessory protein NosD